MQGLSGRRCDLAEKMHGELEATGAGKEGGAAVGSSGAAGGAARGGEAPTAVSTSMTARVPSELSSLIYPEKEQPPAVRICTVTVLPAEHRYVGRGTDLPRVIAQLGAGGMRE